MSNELELTKVSRLDSIPMSAVITDEGYLIDKPIVTSVGIFNYKNPDGSIRRELRPPEQVFDDISLQSYKGKPVIITHAAEHIDKDNTDEIIGTILSDGYKDGNNVRAEIIIHDTDAMQKSKLRELSLGYNVEIDNTPGEWNGQPYDAIQKNIVINHLALVHKARAGEQARLNLDSEENKNNQNNEIEQSSIKPKGEAEAMANKTTKKDENDVMEANASNTADNTEHNEQSSYRSAAQAGQTPEEKLNFIKDRKDRRDSDGIEKTQSDEDVDTLLEIIEQLEAVRDLNEAKQEGSIEKNDNAVADQTGDITIGTGGNASGGTEITIRADSIDKLVSDRIKLGRLGDKINVDVWNMKPQEAKKAIINNKFPTVRLDGKSDGYIDAMFVDVAKDIDAKKDINYQKRQMTQIRKDAANFIHNKSSAEMARAKMENNILNGNGGNK